MAKSSFHQFIILLAFVFAFCPKIGAQCVVINEVLVNAAGGQANCDGGCMPNTAEWTELYNTCNEPVDISCFVMSDGDFAVTMPEGTTIPPNGFLVIGSSNSAAPVDIDIATCGCTSGDLASQVGIFTNSSEMLVLTDGAGIWQDAIYWGTGAFAQTPTYTSSAIGSCPEVTIDFDQNNPLFSALPSQGNNDGNTIYRSCDGGSQWESGTLPPTPGVSNGTGLPVVADFVATETEICVGSCISFSDLSSGNPNSWLWQFEGSNTPTSVGQNPENICYATPGIFNVKLTVANACGSSILTQVGHIIVSEGVVPEIDLSGPITFCSGGSVVLSTGAVGNLQWYNNGDPILNETGPSLLVSETGSYSVSSSIKTCTGISEVVTVNVSGTFIPEITIAGDQVICTNEDLIMSAPADYAFYQWYLNGDPIDGAIEADYTASEAGNYTVLAGNPECSGTSEPLTVFLSTPTPVNLTPNNINLLCPGAVINLTATSGFFLYQWAKDNALVSTTDLNIYTVNSPGIYQVSVQDEFGCASLSNSVQVLYYDAITPPQFVPADTIICRGETIQLGIAPEYIAYQWFRDGILINGATQSDYTATQGGIYSVIVTNVGGCEFSSDLVFLYDATPNNVAITPGGTVQTCNLPLEVSVSMTNGLPVAWQWYNIDGTPLPGETSSNYSVTLPGEYYAAVTNDFGCTANSDTVNVTFTEGFQIELVLSDAEPCEGQTVSLSVAGNYVDYLWSTGAESSSIQVNESGTYFLLVTNADGCSAFDEVQLNFRPLPFVSAGTNLTADCTLGTILQGIGDGEPSWSPDTDLQQPNAFITAATPASNTLYTLTVTDEFGCSASSQVTVFADCSLLIVPNIFTPNGDGDNDQFKVISRGVKEYNIQIFNRWGHLMFESNNPSQAWTGSENGTEAAEGTYMYVVIALDQNGESILSAAQSRGTITLTR